MSFNKNDLLTRYLILSRANFEGTTGAPATA